MSANLQQPIPRNRPRRRSAAVRLLAVTLPALLALLGQIALPGLSAIHHTTAHVHAAEPGGGPAWEGTDPHSTDHAGEPDHRHCAICRALAASSQSLPVEALDQVLQPAPVFAFASDYLPPTAARTQLTPLVPRGPPVL